MTPDKIEIPIPAYFKRDRTEAIAYWDNLLKVTIKLLLLLLFFIVVVVVDVFVVRCCCCCCCCCCSLLLLFTFVVMFTEVMLILLIADTKSIFIITAGVSRKDGRPTREG